MSHLYGVGIDITCKKINLDFKLQLRKRGGIGIRSLKVMFRRFDQNGNGKLDAYQFEQALASCKLFPKKVDLQALMKYYDVDGDGSITYEEFLNGLRDELTERRYLMVEKAWNIMDKDKSGKITVTDILLENIFNVNQNQDYLDGKKTKQQVLQDFLNNFDGVRGNKDGIITKEEWFDYYTDLSSGVPSDEYFVKMMESVWCIPQEEDTVYKQKVEFLTKTIRHKLLDYSNKTQDEYLLRKIFKEFDLDESGALTVDQLAAMLAKLELSVDRRLLFSLFNKFDINKNGTIEFQEFCRFIIFDPYK